VETVFLLPVPPLLATTVVSHLQQLTLVATLSLLMLKLAEINHAPSPLLLLQARPPMFNFPLLLQLAQLLPQQLSPFHVDPVRQLPELEAPPLPEDVQFALPTRPFLNSATPQFADFLKLLFVPLVSRQFAVELFHLLKLSELVRALRDRVPHATPQPLVSLFQALFQLSLLQLSLPQVCPSQ